MKVIKRNDSEQDFCLDKIINAVKKANMSVPEADRMDETAIQKVVATVQKKLEGFNTISVEDIQDLVENSLIRHNKALIAKNYILYRNDKKNKKKFTPSEEKALSLLNGTSELRGDNANKHIDDNGSLRDYFAGLLCKSIANKILPKKITEAHNKGLIHYHDFDYSPVMPMHNCFLGSQKFITERGIERFDSYKDGDKVMVKDKNGVTREATVHTYGKQKMYEIVLKYGTRYKRSIYCTENHGWFLIDGTKTNKIKVGDKLILNKTYLNNNLNIDSIDDARMWCLGFIIGDGCDHMCSNTLHTQVRLCGKKNEYINNFKKAGYRIKIQYGDYVPYIKGISKQDFLESKSWRFLNERQKAFLFLGLMAADGRNNGKSIASSDNRVIDLIYSCAGMANYFITSSKKVTENTNFKDNREITYISFLSPQVDKYCFKVESIKPYAKGIEKIAYCVEEPITHSFTLEGGVITSNCDLLNIEDMFTNGFQMGTTKIEPNDETPFRTICNLLSQISLIVSGRQYGGQTVSWAHTLPYINNSRKLIRKEFTTRNWFTNLIYNKLHLMQKYCSKKVEEKLRQEIAEGVKIYQYQILCHSSSNGQTPFVSNNLCLREAETEQELKDFALLIEEIFKRRIKGVKDKTGHYVSPLFPKLLYWECEGLNVNPTDPYYYLNELAAECEIKRMQPDINSEKECRRIKEGQIIPSMGCVDKDEIVTYRYNGDVFIESILRMYNKFAEIFGEKEQLTNDCYYIDLENVEIYDSTSKGFVKCLRMNRNADASDWKCLKISNGRSLMCTSDHPLAVVGKGRTLVKDINVGDEIECTTEVFNSGREHLDNDYSWLLGTILCDGCYDKQISSSFAMNGEDDIIERYQNAMNKCFGLDTEVVEWHRGLKGNYKEVKVKRGSVSKKETIKKFIDLFGGLRKKERRIPQIIFNSDEETRLSFFGGMIDADGYIHFSDKHNFCYVEIGSTNKELALQQMYLAQSLGYNAKVLLNRYTSKDKSKIRYRIYFEVDDRIIKYITSEKKRNNFNKLTHKQNKNNVYKINEIIDYGYRNEYSYDVTTESDRFDVSLIASHNCRSLLGPIWEETKFDINTSFYWVDAHNIDGVKQYPYGTFVEKRTFKELPNGKYKSGYEEGEYVINFRGNTGWLLEKDDNSVTVYMPKTYGRFNQGVVTINLPHVALEANGDIKEFYKLLDERLELCREALKTRNESVKKIKAFNSEILWMHGALSRMNSGETVGDLMEKYPKRASISLGYAGLYETCRALIHESNTSEKGIKLSKEVLEFMNKKCKEWKEQDNLNYSIYGTPEESLTSKFATANRRDFGVIEYITDKDYVVNSYHVDPREHIDAFKKLEVEGQYLALSSGGAVSYVETFDLKSNKKAILNIMRWMYDHILYAEFNRKIGICHNCGYEGDIDMIKTENGDFIFKCPKCGNTDDNKMDITARLCGYLGKINAGNTNKGRLDDIHSRVTHLDCVDEKLV